MDVSTITQLISNVGFPIAVCVWFAMRNEKCVASMTTAVNELTKVVAVLISKMDKTDGE